MQEIAENICYVGVNDRQKHKFENLWPLPYGVSYNSYLIVDDKTALIDTVDVCYSDAFFRKIEAVLNGRPLNYLVVNHMEPDHSGSLRLLRERYPAAVVVATARAFDMMAGFFGSPVPPENIMEVKDGDTLPLGKRQLAFYTAPMVHWPEVMMSYEVTGKILFSADAFGTFGTVDGGITDEQIDTDLHFSEMYRYYSNIVGKYGAPVQKALAKLAGVEIEAICSTHGPVWKKRLGEAVSVYDRLSRFEGEEGVVIAYGSMYGNTEAMAEAVAEGCVKGGILKVVLHSVSKSDSSYILSDIFRYKGLAIGSPTYCNSLYPGVEALIEKIASRDVANRSLALFGSFSWAGAAVKQLASFHEKSKLALVAPPVEVKQALTPQSYAQCVSLGQALAAAVKEA